MFIFIFFTTAVARAIARVNEVSTTITTCFNHGDPTLCCEPASWTDIAAFFLGNYFAHAATVKSEPGQSSLAGILSMLSALLFPTSGVFQGVSKILTMLFPGSTDLDVARRSGALCMVVRSEKWRPCVGDELTFTKIEKDCNTEIQTISPSTPTSTYDPPWENLRLVPKDFKVHGYAEGSLPEGYELAYVPRNAKVQGGNSFGTVSANYSMTKAFIGVLQALYAGFTLYKSRGDQISEYGYAAFGLTVTPYLLMSVINALANMAVPDYPALYVVGSPILDEAKRRGSFGIKSWAGYLDEDKNPNLQEEDDFRWKTEPIKVELESTMVTEELLVPRTPPFLKNDYPEADRRLLNRFRRWATTSKNKTRPKVDNPEADRRLVSRFRRWANTPEGKNSPKRAVNLIQNDQLFRLSYNISFCISLAPLAIIGGMSRFHKASSTHAERVWTMTWLGFGILIGITIPALKDGANGMFNHRVGRFAAAYLYFLLFYCTPAVGGFVVVGKMLKAYGTCTSV